MDGRKMLLGPALNGEGRGGGEQAGDGERDDQAWGEIEVRWAVQRKGDRHDDCGDGDLEGGELSDGDLRGGVG